MKTEVQINDQIAHVRRNDDGSWANPHLLQTHATETANLAAGFAAKFSSTAWGKVLGLAHDAGKARNEWQTYLKQTSGYDEEAHLEGKRGKIPHAIHGAKLVEETLGKGIGRILAYCIAGHHAGLPDGSSAEGAGQASLLFQLDRMKDCKEFLASFTTLIKAAAPKTPPRIFEDNTDLSLWIRMLYSCLVDADFLNTEAFMDREQAGARQGYPKLSELATRFFGQLDAMQRQAPDTSVNRIRAEIRAACERMAPQDPGLFSLTVPTGGGKTLSSLAFALAHAAEHSLRRVI